MIGIVRGSEIRRNRDGDRNVRILHVEVGDPEDLQSIELATGPGGDHHPVTGSRVVIVDVSPSFRVAVGGGDDVPADAALGPGDRLLYAVDGETIGAALRLLVGGDAVINEGTGTAVEFARLQAEFNQLQSDFDAHLHAYVSPSAPALTSAPTLSTSGVPLAPSTADITSAESPTVRLP